MQAVIPGDTPKVPRATIWCEVQPSNLTKRNLSSIFGDTSTNNPFLTEMIELTSIWNESTLSRPSETLFEWAELPQIKDLIVGLILMPSNQYGDANVTVCIVQAVWFRTSMWTYPEQVIGRTMSNFTYSPPIDTWTGCEDPIDAGCSDSIHCEYPD